VGAAATDKMTGNGRGFGFVTFQDKQGARVLLYSTSTLRFPQCSFPVCVCLCVCARKRACLLWQNSLRSDVVWLVPPVAEKVVAQKHEIRGRTVGVWRARDPCLSPHLRLQPLVVLVDLSSSAAGGGSSLQEYVACAKTESETGFQAKRQTVLRAVRRKGCQGRAGDAGSTFRAGVASSTFTRTLQTRTFGRV
jgi:hypothetical protein